MAKKVYKKVMFVGKATTFMVGLAVILALTVGLASTALAGTGVGARFDLGQTNTVDAITNLVGSVAGPNLVIDNNSTNASATALQLQVESGKAPMKVNSSTKVANLNSDMLDNLDSRAFVRSAYQKSISTQGSGERFQVSDSVSCDGGDFALSGGYASVDSETHVVRSEPLSAGNGWSMEWLNDSTFDTVTIKVVCADVGTPHQ